MFLMSFKNSKTKCDSACFQSSGLHNGLSAARNGTDTNFSLSSIVLQYSIAWKAIGMESSIVKKNNDGEQDQSGGTRLL